MGLTRRRLLEAGLALAACVAVPLGAVLEGTSVVPRGVVEALRGLAYPGRLRRLDPADVRRTGHWLG